MAVPGPVMYEPSHVMREEAEVLVKSLDAGMPTSACAMVGRKCGVVAASAAPKLIDVVSSVVSPESSETAKATCWPPNGRSRRGVLTPVTLLYASRRSGRRRTFPSRFLSTKTSGAVNSMRRPSIGSGEPEREIDDRAAAVDLRPEGARHKFLVRLGQIRRDAGQDLDVAERQVARVVVA